MPRAKRFTLANLITPPPTPDQGPQQRPYVPPAVPPWKQTLQDAFAGGFDVLGGAFGLPGTPDTKARTLGELLSAAMPVVAGVKAAGNLRSMPKMLTKEQMLQRGADGHLSKAFEAHIPLDKLDGLEPVPANDTPDGKYLPGRQITQPIEVIHDAVNDTYMVYAGNHRIAQARANGDRTIPAFVEPDSRKPK